MIIGGPEADNFSLSVSQNPRQSKGNPTNTIRLATMVVVVVVVVVAFRLVQLPLPAAPRASSPVSGVASVMPNGDRKPYRLSPEKPSPEHSSVSEETYANKLRWWQLTSWVVRRWCYFVAKTWRMASATSIVVLDSISVSFFVYSLGRGLKNIHLHELHEACLITGGPEADNFSLSVSRNPGAGGHVIPRSR